MPFQSENQRRYMHANLPVIANRWEKKYGLGGVASLNAELNQLPEYYLPVAHGGRIGYEAAGKVDGPTPEKFLNDKMYNKLRKWMDEYEQYKKHFKKDQQRRSGIEEAAQGGRIGFNQGTELDPKQLWEKMMLENYTPTEEEKKLIQWYLSTFMNQGGMVPSHKVGIYGLAEGGSITKTPEGQTRGFVQSRSDGRRPGYTEDDEDTGGMGHHGGGHGAQTSSSGNGSHDRGGRQHQITARKNAPDPAPTDDSGDDDKAESYVNWNIQETYTGDEDLEGQQEIDKRNAITKLKYDPNLTKDERHSLEVGLGLRQPKKNTLMGNILKGIVTLGTAGAGAGLFGKDLMKVAKLYQNVKRAKQVKTAWDKAKIDLGFKEIDISNIKNKLTSDNQKLMESLPDGHPEKIALQAKMTVKDPPVDDKDGVGSIKIEEIETVNKTKAQKAKDQEYLKMQEAAYAYYLEQQRRRKAYLENYRQMFLANKGGLAGLFRVKNT